MLEYILEFKDKTTFTGKNQIIAEARFLRAYYHFELVKWFGGIPMKGDVRFKVGDEKLFHVLQLKGMRQLKRI
jgi:hypothetical protein